MMQRARLNPKKEVVYIDIDPDTILTEEEQIMCDKALENLKNGNVVDWEDLKKELGLIDV